MRRRGVKRLVVNAVILIVTAVILTACFVFYRYNRKALAYNVPYILELTGFEAEKIGDTYQGRYAQQGYQFYRIRFSAENKGTRDQDADNIFLSYETDESFVKRLYDDGYSVAWGEGTSYTVPVGKTALVEKIISIPSEASTLTVIWRQDERKEREELCTLNL